MAQAQQKQHVYYPEYEIYINIKSKNLLHPSETSFLEFDSIINANNQLNRNKINFAPVYNLNSRLIGYVTKYILKNSIKSIISKNETYIWTHELDVHSIMETNFCIEDTKSDAVNVAKLLLDSDTEVCFIFEKNKYFGYITKNELLQVHYNIHHS